MQNKTKRKLKAVSTLFRSKQAAVGLEEILKRSDVF